MKKKENGSTIIHSMVLDTGYLNVVLSQEGEENTGWQDPDQRGVDTDEDRIRHKKKRPRKEPVRKPKTKCVS